MNLNYLTHGREGAVYRGDFEGNEAIYKVFVDPFRAETMWGALTDLEKLHGIPNPFSFIEGQSHYFNFCTQPEELLEKNSDIMIARQFIDCRRLRANMNPEFFHKLEELSYKAHQSKWSLPKNLRRNVVEVNGEPFVFGWARATKNKSYQTVSRDLENIAALKKEFQMPLHKRIARWFQ